MDAQALGLLERIADRLDAIDRRLELGPWHEILDAVSDVEHEVRGLGDLARAIVEEPGSERQGVDRDR